MILLQQTLPDVYRQFKEGTFDNEKIKSSILNCELTAKSKSVIDRKLKAFYELVRDWLEDDVLVGNGPGGAINIVVTVHREISKNELSDKDKLKLTSVLEEALSYFESMLGHTFRLI